MLQSSRNRCERPLGINWESRSCGPRCRGEKTHLGLPSQVPERPYVRVEGPRGCPAPGCFSHGLLMVPAATGPHFRRRVSLSRGNHGTQICVCGGLVSPVCPATEPRPTSFPHSHTLSPAMVHGHGPPPAWGDNRTRAAGLRRGCGSPAPSQVLLSPQNPCNFQHHVRPTPLSPPGPLLTLMVNKT